MRYLVVVEVQGAEVLKAWATRICGSWVRVVEIYMIAGGVIQTNSNQLKSKIR